MVTTVGKRVLARATVPTVRAAAGGRANHIRSYSIFSLYLSSKGILQSPWHPPRCWSYDCRPGICSGSVEVVVDMRLVSQKLMKRLKVSRTNKTKNPKNSIKFINFQLVSHRSIPSVIV